MLDKTIPTPLTLYMFIRDTVDAHTPSLFTSGSPEDSSYNPLREHEHNKVQNSLESVSHWVGDGGRGGGGVGRSAKRFYLLEIATCSSRDSNG